MSQLTKESFQITTDSTKINRPYVLTKFLTADRSYTKKNIFEKNLIEVCCPHLYALFGTIYDQIDQLFEAQCFFEACLKIDK